MIARPLSFGLLLSAALAIAHCARAESGPTFGSLERASGTTAVTWEWEAAPDVAIDRSLRISPPATRIRSAVLPLRPLTVYEVSTELWRGPGTRAALTVVYKDHHGQPQTWSPVWQSPEGARPDWVPFSPRLQTYVQSFVLPDGATDARVELSAEPATLGWLRGYGAFELTRLHLREREHVPCCRELGRDVLSVSSPEPVWALSGPATWREQMLHVEPAASAGLMALKLVPVRRGSAWRLGLRVRGSGRVAVLVHALRGTDSSGLRVALGRTVEQTVDAADWTQLQVVWIADALGIESAQLVLGFQAGSRALEVEAIELRPYLK